MLNDWLSTQETSDFPTLLQRFDLDLQSAPTATDLREKVKNHFQETGM